MSSVLLVDVDGVIIRPKHKYFSDKLSQDYGIPVESITTFIKGDYKKAAMGEVDIKEILPPHLKRWGYKGTVDEFLEYWYSSETTIDTQLAEIVAQERDRGIKTYLVSDNESGRAEYLMNVVGLKDMFDGGFFSANLGTTKSDPEFFRMIIKRLGVTPTNIEYWDDGVKNVEAARSIGIKAYLYTNVDEFRKQRSL